MNVLLFACSPFISLHFHTQLCVNFANLIKTRVVANLLLFNPASYQRSLATGQSSYLGAFDPVSQLPLHLSYGYSQSAMSWLDIEVLICVGFLN